MIPAFVSCDRDGLAVRVRVTPRARRDAIGGTIGDAAGGVALKVALTAVAEGGKANAALTALLAAAWRLPKSSLSLRLGATARNKIVHVAGDAQALQRQLSQWWQTHE